MSEETNSGSTSRRQFLASLTAAGGVLASNPGLALTPPQPTRIPGAPVSELGGRSSFETPKRMPAFNIVSLTPLQELHGTITPADLHFERHHGGVPHIDPSDHELLIHGMVEKPLKFSVGQLKRFPSVTRTCFIECSGNLNTRADENSSVQMLSG